MIRIPFLRAMSAARDSTSARPAVVVGGWYTGHVAAIPSSTEEQNVTTSSDVQDVKIAEPLVSEVFYTIQGEGPSTGRPALFIRLGGCNLHCKWCDTPYTWVYNERNAERHHAGVMYDPQEELRRVSGQNLVRRILREFPIEGLVVISGGEPMLQQEAIARIVAELRSQPWYGNVEIETAGTILPSHEILNRKIHWNVSPKLSHSGNELELRYNRPALQVLAEDHANFKFVVRHDTIDNRDADLAEISAIVSDIGIPKSKTWIMPLGTSPVEVLQGGEALVESVMERKWNLTLRTHTLLWGNERGH